jgi:hypothetical protein
VFGKLGLFGKPVRLRRLPLLLPLRDNYSTLHY